MKICKEYLDELCNINNLKTNAIENEWKVDISRWMGAPISITEFDAAVRDLRLNEVCGIDDIPAMLTKNGGEKTWTSCLKS